MVLWYVYYCCVFTPRLSNIDDLILELGREFVAKEKVYQAFWLTDEVSISEYLGLKIGTLPDGGIKLSQTHLIDKII